MTVGSQETLSVIGGNVTIEGAQLKAPGGTVQVASVGYGGEVIIRGEPIYEGSDDIVIGYVPVFQTTGPLGNITVNPGKSFAALDAGPNGTVQNIPALTFATG